MKNATYHLYSHADADGGIASAIFIRFLRHLSGNSELSVVIQPVNHGPEQPEWTQTDLKYPCAILDFSLHPALLTDKFFTSADGKSREDRNLPCFWIDHHPTGSGMPFLTTDNCSKFLTNITSLWDVDAISTPGLLRTHHETLGIPRSLIEDYEELIDQAEIIDGALFANAQSAHDFSSDAVKLQTLFSTNHKAIDKTALYRQLVNQLVLSPSIDELMRSDPLLSAIVEYEQALVLQQRRLYEKKTIVEKNVSLTHLFDWSENQSFPGLGRFIPYLLFPEIQYAVHVQPAKNGVASVSCGINPWNKPKSGDKHLGNYFATHFGGGGHAFVAGGRITSREIHKIDELVNFLKN
ncbi:MAG: hypothetical protein RL189_2463 [Pseudomonadota bacterium]|jgi:hypothetical protein